MKTNKLLYSVGSEMFGFLQDSLFPVALPPSFLPTYINQKPDVRIIDFF